MAHLIEQLTSTEKVAQRLAGLSFVLAVMGALLPAVPIGQESIVERDGWPVLLALLAPSLLVVIGMWGLYMWDTRRSKVAQWSAWLISLMLLLGSIVDQGIGLHFWPAATVFLLEVTSICV